jgi:rubrerythrin
MGAVDLDSYVRRSRAVDLTGVDFDAVRERPLAREVVRVLRYMQDIEAHTIVYVRTMLHTRAVDDPATANFLACWFNEEMAHGRALARFLTAAGERTIERRRSRTPTPERIEQVVTGLLARSWPSFVAVHMTWGALNEMTAVHAYRRLAEIADHPVLTDLLVRLVRDESRHFDFYLHQAARHLQRRGAARVTRLLVDRFWGPVGTGVQPRREVDFVGRYLFSGPRGHAAARRIDSAIGRLTGFEDARPFVGWLERASARAAARSLA